MSREFNRYVEKQFALRMKRFDLDPVRASGPIAWPGERCFRTRGEGTVCWLCIFPNYKGLNEFNIELAWSHLGEYPASCTARPTLQARPPDCFAQHAQGFIRLGEWADPPRASWGADSLLEPLAMLQVAQVAPLADPLIEDAIRTIEVVGLPLMAQARAARATFQALCEGPSSGSGPAGQPGT